MSRWQGVSGKRVLVTGATDGIGLAACEALARLGARLAIVGRSEAKAEHAVARIVAAGGPEATPDVLMADLASQDSVRGLAAQVLEQYPKLDALVNNAGAVFTKRRLSPDGVELTWALNHLAPFLLTDLLLERLVADGPARIVTTSSAAHNGAQIPFEDLNAQRSYHGFRRYQESKLANVLFTNELAARLGEADVTANCFHPGLVATGFGRNNGVPTRIAATAMRPFMRRPEQGADTLVWLVDSPEVDGLSGLYFADRTIVAPSPAAQDPVAARRLWDVSAAQVASA